MSEQAQLFTCAGGVPAAYPLFQGGGGGSIPTSALQFRFERISPQLATRLNARWHSVLPYLAVKQAQIGTYSECFVAAYDNAAYATAIWTSPLALNRMAVKTAEEIIELRRLAICPQAPKNTASRMLAWMVRDLRRRHPPLRRFISYQATDQHDGTIYRAAGWQPVARSPFRPWASYGHRCPTQIGSDKVRWERVLEP